MRQTHIAALGYRGFNTVSFIRGLGYKELIGTQFSVCYDRWFVINDVDCAENVLLSPQKIVTYGGWWYPMFVITALDQYRKRGAVYSKAVQWGTLF